MLWPKKNSYKEFDNEKKFLQLENSPPPHNFSNGRSLSLQCHLYHTYIDANDANVQHDTQRRAAKTFDIDQHKKNN